MNQPAFVWLVRLPPKRTGWRWVRRELSAGANFFLGARKRVPHYDRVTPLTLDVKLSHNNTPSSPPHPALMFPRNWQILFLSRLDWTWNRSSFASKFTWTMLMSASRLLMIRQINGVLMKVLLSVHFFFVLSGQVFWRRLPKRSQQPVKASPSVLTLKGHFPLVFFLMVRPEKNLPRVRWVQLDGSSEKNGRPSTRPTAWMRFSNPRQLKTAVPALCFCHRCRRSLFYFLWPNLGERGVCWIEPGPNCVSWRQMCFVLQNPIEKLWNYCVKLLGTAMTTSSTEALEDIFLQF